jgi:hypothetical protein
MTNNTSLPEYLVAFVDLLGFSNEVKNIKDNHDFQEVLQKIKYVHDIFGKNLKDKYDIEERELSERYVLSLSDSVIIATALNSRISETMGVFDNWCYDVHTIGINQAICAANGIFLRGGISKGQFYFENDILISQAMITAYETEKNVSTYPIICLDDLTYKWFESHKDNNCYAEYIKPINTLFKTFSISAEKTVYAIDYIGIGISAAEEEFSCKDQQEYSKASKKMKDKVKGNIAKRNAIKFINAHKMAIETELEKSHKCDIMCKFLWLRRYHNDTVIKVFPHHKELLIL